MNFNRVLFCLYVTGLVSCYSGKKSNSYLKPINEFKDVEYLTNLTEIVCSKVKEGKTKRVAIRSDIFNKLKAEEVSSIEECVILKGARIDTARGGITRNQYLYDSSIYVDFRVIRKGDSTLLSVWYPLGWDMDCGTGTFYETYQLDKRDSILVVGRKLREGI